MRSEAFYIRRVAHRWPERPSDGGHALRFLAVRRNKRLRLGFHIYKSQKGSDEESDDKYSESMKRVRFGRLLSLSAVLVFFAVAEVEVVSAAERSQAVVGRQRGGYTKDAWSVYYAGRKVEGLSASGFVDLGGGYGKDAWTVDYCGRKIEGAAEQSFE